MAEKKTNHPPSDDSASESEPAPEPQADEDAEPASGTSLAEEAIAPRADHKDIEERIKELSPEEAAMFVQILEITMKRRRVMLLGYLAALFAFVIGMGWALYMFGTHEKGTFVGWVFLVPVALVGLILWLFGRWARHIEK